ncbi:HAD family hydrolase [Trinickia dinghuensis]|uniref:HAD family hydrolase n=1 Tax=Trinickia dinghuensis TaxID=2291023 RepID=A0A3D8K610_9BURK|nr:HAD-IA family hydrolase [Trinickia dinghuensis]RDV00749.1 HAD family hydrolase [Trinickia dinghuensis]
MQDKFSLLFDLDGTLANTDEHHFGAFQVLLGERGRSISIETYQSRIMGATNDVIMREFFPDVPEHLHPALADRKEALFRASVTHMEPAAGALKIFEWARSRGVGIAVVTNAPRANAELMLNGLGLADRIDTLVIGDELPRGKPDPLPYLTGLERLGASAERALAFEDSLSGIRAASAAGIYTFGMRTALPTQTLLDAGANDVIDDFTAASLWRMLDDVAQGAVSMRV